MVKPASVPPVPSVPAAIPDPTLLLTAAVSRLAATIGVRLIVIKGIAADQYGLRPAHISSDVDVLVTHDDYGTLLAELESRGWRRRASDPDTDTFPVHSASMFHPEWAADIDVHFRYPGLEVDGDVFDPIWAQRTTMWCGNQPICIPGLVDAILIGAVHAIRSRFSRRHRAELDFLVGRCSRMDVTLLLERADQLGALATARPLLERLKPFDAEYDWGEASAEWRLRTEIPDASQRRVVLWKQAAPRERLTKLRLALFPPASAFVKETTATTLGPVQLAGRYLRRWRRGARALPKALAVLRASRRRRP
ncbi:nucleotidyltransferase family protein [Leifsonia sp. NPDC056824]|uniref:nucleotidyltransferase family protein n=1 Tax=Leifsonia sp. NPDC056824 TaxID=3345953 RepID=UPI0036A20BBD